MNQMMMHQFFDQIGLLQRKLIEECIETRPVHTKILLNELMIFISDMYDDLSFSGSKQCLLL